MSTKNKKSVAAQALLEMDNIISEIKEESKKSLNVILSEAVRNALREGCCDEDEDEKDYEVIDDEKNDAEDKGDKSKNSSTSDVDEDENNEMENGAEAEQPIEPQGSTEANAMAQTQIWGHRMHL